MKAQMIDMPRRDAAPRLRRIGEDWYFNGTKGLPVGLHYLGERFFHGMYVSAQGNPTYGTVPVDSVSPPENVVLQIGHPALNLFFIMLFIALLTLISIYYVQQYRLLSFKTPATL